MNGSYTTTSVIEVQLGDDPEATVTFYVTETDANGTPLENGAALEFEVSVDGTEATVRGNADPAKVTITNT